MLTGMVQAHLGIQCYLFAVCVVSGAVQVLRAGGPGHPVIPGGLSTLAHGTA